MISSITQLELKMTHEKNLVAHQIQAHANALSDMRQSLTQKYSSIGAKEFSSKAAIASRIAINHSLTKNDIREMLMFSNSTLKEKLQMAEADNVIGPYFEHGGGHRYFHDDVIKLLDYLEIPKYSDEFNSSVICISNHKGGVSKSTSVITLGTGLATNMLARPRLCLVDLDPQGTTTENSVDETKVNSDIIQLTAMDLVLGDVERHHENPRIRNEEAPYNLVMDEYIEDGYTEEDALEEMVKNAALPTHLSNLKVLAGFTSDERLSDVYGCMTDEEQRDLILRFSQKIIPILKEEFDIIIIDTPPQDSGYSWMALDAANGIIVPTSPSPYCVSSSSNYIESLAPRLNHLPSGANHFDFYRMTLTNYNQQNKIHEESRRKLIKSSRGNLLSKHLSHSPLFSLASEAGLSVYDFIQKDVLDRRLMSAKVFNETRSSVNDWVKEIQDLIFTYAAK